MGCVWGVVYVVCRVVLWGSACVLWGVGLWCGLTYELFLLYFQEIRFEARESTMSNNILSRYELNPFIHSVFIKSELTVSF